MHLALVIAAVCPGLAQRISTKTLDASVVLYDDDAVIVIPAPSISSVSGAAGSTQGKQNIDAVSNHRSGDREAFLVGPSTVVPGEVLAELLRRRAVGAPPSDTASLDT